MEESYEKKLYNIFKSFDNNKNDELDYEEMNALCETLQLDFSQRKQLWSFLDQNSKVSFEQFRDALVYLINNDSKYETCSRDISPIREISANHVFGKKKYYQSVSTNSETSTSEVSSTSYYLREDNLPNSMMLSMSFIIGLWENCGIPDSVNLLQKLEINTSLDSVYIPDLITTVNNQLNKVQNNFVDSSLTQYNNFNKPFVLLKALNSLNEYQIKWLKMIIKEINRETDKLKDDIDAANNRATTIAQEVDENHLRIELSSSNKINALEHKHHKEQKALIDQWRSEKDELFNQKVLLNDKLQQVQKYKIELQSELLSNKKQLCLLKSENTELNEQLDEIKQKYVSLKVKVQEISKLKLKELETEDNNEQIIDLVKKIDCLKNENKCLRDQNDELVNELEATKLIINVGTGKSFEGNIRNFLAEKNSLKCSSKVKEFSIEEGKSDFTTTFETYIVESDFETRNKVAETSQK